MALAAGLGPVLLGAIGWLIRNAIVGRLEELKETQGEITHELGGRLDKVDTKLALQGERIARIEGRMNGRSTSP